MVFAAWAYAPVAMASPPMDSVIELLDTGGGLRSGKDDQQGYFVVSLAFSSESSVARAKESARLDALRQLTEFIHGASVSGNTISSQSYQKIAGEEFSESYFSELIQTRFKGQLNAIKVIKQGRYQGQHFVAMSISEQDTQAGQALSQSMNSGSRRTSSNTTAATSIRTVEASGYASLRLGTQQAREQAILDALKNAVQQIKGVMLKGSSGRFGDSVSLAINSKTQGYVHEYELIQEHKVKGEFRVDLVAEVDSSSLERDLSLYLDMFSSQHFYLEANNPVIKSWLTNELKAMGFNLSVNKQAASYLINAQLTQQESVNHLQQKGIETSIDLSIVDTSSGELLTNIRNVPAKTRIYVSPLSRAKAVSQKAALKKLKVQLKNDLITSLSQVADRGLLYKIEIKNANRRDLKLFRHVLEGGTGGRVESWDFKKEQKVLTLNFRYAGSLSTALDEGLEQLYLSYKQEGKGRRPKAIDINKSSAHFMINVKGKI